MKNKWIVVVSLATIVGLSVPSAAAVSLGGCDRSGDAQDLALNPHTGDVVTVGMERIGVRRGGVSNADWNTLQLPYGGKVLAAPEGDRFAIRRAKTVYLYDFHTFQRTGKTRVKVLKDQSIWAYKWLAGSDDIIVLGAIVKSSIFDMKTTKAPHLLRFNLTTGEGSLKPLQLADDFRTAIFDEEGKRIALSFNDSTIEIRSAVDGSLQQRFQVHEPENYYGLGMAFHPTRNVLLSTSSNTLVYYDLEAERAEAVYKGIQGGPFLRFVARGRYLIMGGHDLLTFADLEGRPLETSRPTRNQHFSEYYSEFRIAEPLQKVYTLGSELVCWRSFERWQKVAAADEEAAALEVPDDGGEVMYRGQPLSHYIAQLDDEDFTTRLMAFQSLEAMGPAAAPAVPKLMRVLEGDEPARMENEPALVGPAMAVLGTMGAAAEPAVPLIAGFLESDNTDHRRAAVQCLSKLGPVARAAVPQLTETIRDPVIDIQMVAIQTLGTIGPDAAAALPALEELRKEGGRMKAMSSSAIEAIK